MEKILTKSVISVLLRQVNIKMFYYLSIMVFKLIKVQINCYIKIKQ